MSLRHLNLVEVEIDKIDDITETRKTSPDLIVKDILHNVLMLLG